MTWYDDTPDAPDYLSGGGSDEERWPADGLDRLIAETAREYNAPPPTVPRDAMWEAITAARAPHAATPTPVTTPVTTPVISLADRRAERGARTRGLIAVAAAAAIFLATGIGIGRWWGLGARVADTTGGAAQVASRTPTAPSPAPVATRGDSTTPADTAAPESPDTPRSTQLAAATSRRSAGRTGGRDRGALTGPATDAYDVAVLRHFAQVEALLVSYRADTVDAAMDARLAAWARPLLGDTRLLLDSPAANDPRRRRLLEDLELVLAELTRLAPTGTVAATDSASAPSSSQRTERQLIDGTLRRGQLLPRLRTMVPAGT